MEAMTSESPRVLGEATLAELRTRMLGPVISPGDPGYENARQVWNGAIDMHPALVLRCSGVADVISGVQFACSEGLPVAIRGGAHSVAGFSTCDGGVVLDLSEMTAVRVDLQKQNLHAIDQMAQKLQPEQQDELHQILAERYGHPPGAPGGPRPPRPPRPTQ